MIISTQAHAYHHYKRLLNKGMQIRGDEADDSRTNKETARLLRNANIRLRRAKGEKAETIAKDYGLRPNTVKAITARVKVEDLHKTPAQRKAKATRTAIFRLLGKGKTPVEIVALGYPMTSTYKYAKEILRGRL